jgi:hypothetical protein
MTLFSALPSLIPQVGLFNNNNNIYLTAVGLSPGGSGF